MMISDGESSPGGSKGSRNSKNSNKNSKAKKKTAAGVEDVEMAEMAILASIFLCKYEIIKDGVESWRLHLKGIESLCRSLSPEQTASMANTLAYVRSLYVANSDDDEYE